MSFKGNSISTLEYEALINDASSDEALPDMRYKQDILSLFNDFTGSFADFQEAYISQRVIDVTSRSNAIIAMLRIFNYVKFMVKQKGAWNIDYKEVYDFKGKTKIVRSLKEMNEIGITDYERMILLDRGVIPKSYMDLLHLKDYVLWCFHICHLTNLLIDSNRIDVRKELRRDMGLG